MVPTTIYGTAGADHITGTDGNDALYAFATPYVPALNYLSAAWLSDGGHNHLAGGAGNDTLTGSAAGCDTLIGGAGNDVLIASGTGDVLTGGAGADTFRFSSYIPGNVNAEITDFQHGTDHLDFSGLHVNYLHMAYGPFTEHLYWSNAAGLHGSIALDGNPHITAGDFLL